MNGHDLVLRVLATTGYDVGPLIELAGGHETEWLEFKAALLPDGGVLPPNESWDDYTWHVAEALFALANGIGGAVILGVAETENRTESVRPVGLAASGYTGDYDKFVRELYDLVLDRPSGWRTTDKRFRHLKCDERPGLFRPIKGRFLGELVAIILVQPRHPDDRWLALTSRHSKRSERDGCIVPSRVPGDFGRNEVFETAEDAAEYWKTRRIERPDLDELFLRFKATWDAQTQAPGNEPRSDPGAVANAIRAYLDGMRRAHAHRDALFTPLEAILRVEAVVNGQQALMTKRSSILRSLGEHPRAILVGESGSGKSTSLAHIALSRSADWTPGGHWALLVSLAAYSRHGLRTLLLRPLPDLVWTDLEAEIESGRVALLLDGLNECPVELLDQCCADIGALLRQFPASRLVVASTSAEGVSQLGLPRFELAPMGREHQRRFLELRTGDHGRADELLDRLYRQPGADFFASNPGLLSVVAEISGDIGTLPAGRAALYRRFIEHWYQRAADRARTADTSLRSSLSEVRSGLARLAFRMRSRGWTSCDRSFAVHSLAEVIADDADAVLDHATTGFLLVDDERDRTLRFSHETLQDYLAAEHIAGQPESLTLELLDDAANARACAWAMPLVLALELMPDPPEGLLENAWRAEPLLVGAVLRDGQRLATLPPDSDPWTRGLLHAMRGEDPAPAAREIALTGHHPPKYPYPEPLVRSLRGRAFWYAGLTHPEGVKRLERIQRLLLEGGYPWFELLFDACAGNPSLRDRLTPVQQVMVGTVAQPATSAVLDSATIPELCVLLRTNKIEPEACRRRWSPALRRDDRQALEQDLLCLLAAEKWLQGEFSPMPELVRAYGPQLRLIGRNRNLTFRLLNLLVKHKVLSAREIRSEDGRLMDILERTSATNLYRFLVNGVLSWNDLTPEDAERLLWQLKPGLLKKLQLANLVPPEGVASALQRRDRFKTTVTSGGAPGPRKEAGSGSQPSVRFGGSGATSNARQLPEAADRPRYSNQQLASLPTRQRLEAEVRTRRWDLTVEKVFPDREFGFAKHPAFQDTIFFSFRAIRNMGNQPLSAGDTLRANIAPQRDARKDSWGFAVLAAERLQET